MGKQMVCFFGRVCAVLVFSIGVLGAKKDERDYLEMIGKGFEHNPARLDQLLQAGVAARYVLTVMDWIESGRLDAKTAISWLKQDKRRRYRVVEDLSRAIRDRYFTFYKHAHKTARKDKEHKQDAQKSSSEQQDTALVWSEDQGVDTTRDLATQQHVMVAAREYLTSVVNGDVLEMIYTPAYLFAPVDYVGLTELDSVDTRDWVLLNCLSADLATFFSGDNKLSKEFDATRISTKKILTRMCLACSIFSFSLWHLLSTSVRSSYDVWLSEVIDDKKIRGRAAEGFIAMTQKEYTTAHA